MSREPFFRSHPQNEAALWLYASLLLALDMFRDKPKRKIAPKNGNGSLSGLDACGTRKMLYMWQARGSPRPVSAARLPGGIKAKRKAAKSGKGKLYALYARSADDARAIIRAGGAKEAHQLEGSLVNCALWQETYSPHTDKPVFRCLMYAPACDPTPEARPPSPGKSGKKCITFHKIYSPKSEKQITRCKKYGMVSTAASCLPETMPTPDREMYVPSRKEIKALAKSMSEEKNALEAEAGPWVAREIMSRGGIAPYRGKYLAEEYRAIPLHLKNKKGLPLDQMADELKTDEAGLVKQIAKAYPKGEKKKRRFAASDFEREAEVFLYRQHEQFGGIGDDLFVNLRREAALTTDDPATSDDLFVACMERRGWKPKRMTEIQDSIAEKMTPDLFTGKKGKLTGGEAQYQDEVDRCLAQMTRQRKSGKPKAGQMRLFGTLAGMVSCCVAWEKSGISPNGKPFYRCTEFAPTCSPPADDCLEMKSRRPDQDEDQQQDVDKIKAKRVALLEGRRYSRSQKASKRKPKPAPAPKKTKPLHRPKGSYDYGYALLTDVRKIFESSKSWQHYAKTFDYDLDSLEQNVVFAKFNDEDASIQYMGPDGLPKKIVEIAAEDIEGNAKRDPLIDQYFTRQKEFLHTEKEYNTPGWENERLAVIAVGKQLRKQAGL